MTKKLFIILPLFALVFTSCGKRSTFDEGVMIDGVRWATRNVATPGTFTQNPEDAGMFFQWNRYSGISTTIPEADVPIENWNSTVAIGTEWAKANDPCPQGWRVPTEEEIRLLRNTSSKWTTRNGVYGRYFGTAPHQIFLPAPGGRNRSTGALNHANKWAGYWSSTEDNENLARYLFFNIEHVRVHGYWRSVGFSVRCVASN